MNNLLALTQRVVEVGEYRERRDALDQRWTTLLERCGFLPVLVPNRPAAALRLLETVPVRGVVFTGGNDLAQYGGDAPERDETERRILERALRTGTPVLGVCRGMQVIQSYFGVPLHPVANHVTKRQAISASGAERHVNSYHCWGASTTTGPLGVWAQAPDGVIEAVRHAEARIQGIMWHPEREDPFDEQDLALLTSMFTDQ